MRPARVTATDNPLRDPRDKRLPRIAGPCSLVMFGVTGDLARKKLMPAIYDLANRGLLPPGFSLVGFARRDWEDQDFGKIVYEAVKAHARTPFREEVWRTLAEGIRFVPGSFDDDAAFDLLAETVAELDEQRGSGGNVAFYLSIPPGSFATVCQQLERSGLSSARRGSWRRVVIEKPFGHDLESARELNDIVGNVFPADSVFRIDHYLGKETVQNLLAVRFANTMFEPVWNNRYVDHVQITMAEDIGIGGRAGYYDGIGAARDVIQNHLLQLMALTAMEEPVSFDAHHLRLEKEKVLSAIKLPDDLAAGTARGQYSGGWQGGDEVVGYLEEDGVAADSTTETYAAVRLDVDTRRWAGVPFYLRTGKRLGKRVTEIAVVFTRAPHLPFTDTETEELGQNAVVIRVQPDEGVTLRFGAKVPGAQMEVRDVSMDFGYGRSFTESSPEAYERLILDVLLGEPPLFPRHEEVELSWQILDPVEKFWARRGKAPDQYEAGTWGPASADELMRRDGREWRLPVIVDLPNTSTQAVSKRLVKLREDTGAMALSRVLTLVVVVHETDADDAIDIANDASRQHPCRIIVVVTGNRRGAARLDGQIRVGGDAGASEVVVLRLYGPLAGHGRAVVTPLLLADSPIVAWWPTEAPKDPAADPIGAMAQRRITDAARTGGKPRAVLKRLAGAYRPGDTDLSWSRVTLWRALLTAALDQPPFERVTEAMVVTAPESPSGELLAGWLAARLRCPVRLAHSKVGSGIISVRLVRASGTVDLVRPEDGSTSMLRQPGQPDRTLALPHRGDAECLADELRHLDPDEVYEAALTAGLPAVRTSRVTASEAVRAGDAPSPAEAAKVTQRLRRAASASGSSATVEKMPMPEDTASSEAVQEAAATRLADVKEKRS